MSGQEQQVPGLLEGFGAIIRRDLLLAWKRPGDVLNPLFFFAMVASLFPLAVGPSPEQLMLNGPGVVWVAALLATLLSLNSLFLADFEDGSLDQIILSPQPLPLLGLGKAAAPWLLTGLPLVLVSPLIAMTSRLPGDLICGAKCLTGTAPGHRRRRPSILRARDSGVAGRSALGRAFPLNPGRIWAKMSA